MKKVLHMSELKNLIRRTERIEKYIAIKNDRIVKHQNKWCKINHEQGNQNLEHFLNAYFES